jgi:hypothetical protein
LNRNSIEEHIGRTAQKETVMEIWDVVRSVAPFAYRVIDEINKYISESVQSGSDWKSALDEQIVQKILPKIKGDNAGVENALLYFTGLSPDDYVLTVNKSSEMLERYRVHGFASYF